MDQLGEQKETFVKKHLDFDDILEHLGELGLYQRWKCFLLCLIMLFVAPGSLGFVFNAGIPTYRCFVPDCDNENSEYTQPWIEYAIPSSNDANSYTAHQCLMFIRNTTENNKTCNFEDFTNNTIKCKSWVYENNERTIVNDWNITCVENQWKLSFVGTIHFAAFLVSSVPAGIIADKYGRKVTLILGNLFMLIGGAAQVLCVNYILYLICVFVASIGTNTVYTIAFIAGMELVGKSKRDMYGTVVNYFYSLGKAMVPVIAWLSKDWIITQTIISVPTVIFLLYYWFIPESIRWLMTQNRFSEAEAIVKEIAKVNKVELSDQVLDTFQNKSFQMDGNIKQKSNSMHSKTSICNNDKTNIWKTIANIFKSKKLCFRSLNLCFNWIANSFVYYGLSFNSVSLAGSKYINFGLVSLVEIPAYTIAWGAMNYFGRRISLAISLLICGITCFIWALIPEEYGFVIVGLSLIGKLGVTSSFSILYVYTTELYPTIVRSAGVGISSTASRLGGMVAPFAPLLGTYMKPLPGILFGGISLAAGLLTLLLPETLGKKLPETVEEIEKL